VVRPAKAWHPAREFVAFVPLDRLAVKLVEAKQEYAVVDDANLGIHEHLLCFGLASPTRQGLEAFLDEGAHSVLVLRERPVGVSAPDMNVIG